MKRSAEPNAPAFDPNDIGILEQRHRDAMLDLILAWGELDGALGILLSRFLDVALAEGADLIGRTPGSAKMAEIVKRLREARGGDAAARTMKKHKKSYERYAKPRNCIAHSKCLGVWTRDPEFVVFAVFERVEEDLLAIDRVPIEEMQRATRWGKAMTALALKLSGAPPGEA